MKKYVEEKFRLEVHILATNIVLKLANCSVKQKLALIRHRRALQDDLRALIFDNTSAAENLTEISFSRDNSGRL